MKLDTLDMKILDILQKDCRISLEKMAEQLEVPKSTLHYRIKKLTTEKIITGYYAKLDASKLGHDYTTITFVRVKLSPNSQKRVGRKLAKIPGVVAVYFLFGKDDFLVLTVSRDRKNFLEKLEMLNRMSEIESINTIVVADTIKDDSRLKIINSSNKKIEESNTRHAFRA
jgi:DNA-binding Lrp family transcriptional regulator